ncbi:glycoside hydrolase family 18 protein [Bipolaris zeicola 26-R-13]|uniref:chitinase n=2 Tax=Bipolaris TaxID=33194 RepID=W6YRU0_COCC2|nr:glycoside hydrolase family 18 protein [Bipolaris zeicola 26-R-13]EUC34226.1 glycoside hydrolase family 18 protein [Bipolaris zeicola 26-R-13]
MRASLLSLLLWPALSFAVESNTSFVPTNRTSNHFNLLELPVGTCNAQTPCVNGACCSGVSGLCGYSPSECGVGNCTSNCDAKAECGQYGVPGKQTCPLGVCCSKFGFCGSTDDFCDVDGGCQKDFGGCGPPKRPSCSKDGTSVNKRSIGYYETWANTRPCSAVAPEQLNLQGLTHINFAFMFFEPDTFELTPMDRNAGSLISRFTKLKERKPGLETWVSVGGWSFNDPGKYQQAFSIMSSTAANRKKFIDNLIKFMETYGFDGMDMDWEYPTADDRGGKPEDKANFVLLSRDIYNAFEKKGYGYSLTLPASYWYLQHFDLAKLQPYVHWFNLMSYDLHGTWDAASKFVGPYVATHTNLTEIDLGLDLLWRAGVKPENVVLGQGLYGRSFTLTDPKCNEPNGVCQFSGGAKAGRCSRASGILNLQEIFDIIDDKKLKPTHDKKAGVKWIHWDDDQWVSYDDDETLMQKREFGASRCLGGMMIWALDQIDQDTAIGGSLSPEEMEEAEAMYQDAAAKGVCYTTMCNDKCRNGDYEAAQMRGQPGLLSTMTRCPKDQVRRLCCSKGVTMGTCKWRGFRGLGLSCTGGCHGDETEVTTNTNHVDKNEDQTCTGGTQSYCCSGFKPPISKEQVSEKIKDEAADLALAAAETLAMEIAAKAFCRVAIMAATLPLRIIPFVGWIASIALQVAMPALVNVCAKGVAKAGKSVFNFKGKDYEVKVDKPLTSKVDRPASSSPTKASDRPKTCRTKRLAARDLRPRTEWLTNTYDPPGVRVTHKVCNGARAKQACYNYSSIINRRPDLARLTCPSFKHPRPARPQVDEYNQQHNTHWSSGWLRSADLECQRDEYPGAAIWQARDDSVWIRLIPRADNAAAAHLFAGCPDAEEEEFVRERSITTTVLACGSTRDVWQKTYRKMEVVMSINFNNMQNMPPDFGMTANLCWPETLVNDPGFALLTDDPWYARGNNRGQFTQYYNQAPLAQFTNGKVNQPTWGWTKPRANNVGGGGDKFKRSPNELVIHEGNSTRKPTEEELFGELGLLKCEERYCQREMEELGFASLPVVQETQEAPVAVRAEATPTDGSAVVETKATPVRVQEADVSVITPAPRHPHYRYE